MIFFQNLTILNKILLSSLILPFLLFLFLSLCIYFLKRLEKLISNDILTSISAGLLMSITFIRYVPQSLEMNSAFTFSIVLISSLVILLLIETHVIPLVNFKFLALETDESMVQCDHIHHHHHHPFSHTSSLSAVGCLILCAFFDGLKITGGLFLDSTTALITLSGTLLHILPEGLAVLFLTHKSRLSKKATIIIQTIFCTSFALGMLLTSGLHALQVSNGIILSISTATLIYLTFIHLLPVSFNRKNQVWFLSSLFITSAFLLAQAHS